MKDIVIIGAGHLGLDVYNLIQRINAVTPTWNLVGFLNDVPSEILKYTDKSLIGPIKGWNPRNGECYALAIGATHEKERIANEFKAKGAQFPVLISPDAIVNRFARIDEGAMVMSTSKVGPGAHVGKFAVVGDTTIAMEAELGDYSNTASYANIYKQVKVGMRVQIWSHSVILNSVGDDAIVGAGSIVISKVKPGTKVFGAPAKRVDF